MSELKITTEVMVRSTSTCPRCKRFLETTWTHAGVELDAAYSDVIVRGSMRRTERLLEEHPCSE